MHLVDPKQWQRMDQLMTPTQRTISRLDQEMESILMRSDLSDSEKVTQYNQILQRYLEFQDRPKQELAPPPPPAKDLESEVFLTVPKALKRKAEALIHRLKKDPTISWNERGELIYQGRIVPGTNMTDLINDALRPRKTFEPHGWQEFARALRHGNVPQDLIGHRKRWDWMHRESATSDAFSTAEESPGEERISRSMLKTPSRKRSHPPERKSTRRNIQFSPQERKIVKKINWETL